MIFKRIWTRLIDLWNLPVQVRQVIMELARILNGVPIQREQVKELERERDKFRRLSIERLEEIGDLKDRIEQLEQAAKDVAEEVGVGVE